MRENRKNQEIRDKVSETNLLASDFIYPIFVKEGSSAKEEIEGFGQYRYSLNDVDSAVKECEEKGVKGIMLFGIPAEKGEGGAFSEEGIVQQTIKKIKEVSKITIYTDVCLCQYMAHGHCGVLKEGDVDNDETLELLGKVALSHAKAGADYVCPSAMMDFQVKAIRDALDASGFDKVKIMSYSAKFASNFYGPFREAVKSVPNSDRKTYQMDFRNSSEAMKEIELDIEEGADIVMVKPALAYLDVISKAKEKFDVKVAAFNVSGEYAMLDKDMLCEVLIGIKRAGADIIISYGALEVLK